MGPIRAEWFKAKCLVFSLLFLTTLCAHIESAPAKPNKNSAPAKPNKNYHTVGLDTFRFQFQAEEPFSNYSEKGWGQTPKRNGGVTKLLQHNIHSLMINSTSSTQWMKNVVLQSLAGDKTRANAIMAASRNLLSVAGSETGSRPRRRPWAGAKTTVPLGSGKPYGTSFVVSVRLGTPAKREIKMSLDTANDVSWLRCNYRGGSSSFKKLTCDSCDSEVEGLSCNRNSNRCVYQVEYESGEGVKAHLSEDTLWLGSRPFRKFSFGCVQHHRIYFRSPSWTSCSEQKLSFSAFSDRLPVSKKVLLLSPAIPASPPERIPEAGPGFGSSHLQIYQSAVESQCPFLVFRGNSRHQRGGQAPEDLVKGFRVQFSWRRDDHRQWSLDQPPGEAGL